VISATDTMGFHTFEKTSPEQTRVLAGLEELVGTVRRSIVDDGNIHSAAAFGQNTIQAGFQISTSVPHRDDDFRENALAFFSEISLSGCSHPALGGAVQHADVGPEHSY
jgi:hypothetical protein